MAVVGSPDDRRVYIRNMSSKIASIVSTVLSEETAFALAHIFKDLLEESEKAGAHHYLTVLEGCSKMCDAVDKHRISEEQFADANEVLKDCLLAVQTSLFSFALYGRTETEEAKFKDKVTRINQFLNAMPNDPRAPAAPAPQATEAVSVPPPPAPPSAPAEPTRTQMQAQAQVQATPPAPPKAPPQGAGRASALPATPPPFLWKKAPPQNTESGVDAREADTASSGLHPNRNDQAELVRTVAATIEALWDENRFKRVAVELSRAALKASGIRFAEICKSLENEYGFELPTTTPDALVDVSLAQAVRDQALHWLKEQDPAASGPSASVRTVGNSLVLEISFSKRFQVNADALRKAVHAHLADGETYINRLGQLVQRRSFRREISVFEAFTVRCGEDRYLISAEDVCGAEPAGEVGTLEIQAHMLFKCDPSSGPKRTLWLSWRGQKVGLLCDEWSGPEPFIARSIIDPGSIRRGIIGMARVQERLGFVADIVACLDLAEQTEFASAKSQIPSKQSQLTLFRVGGHRIGVPSAAIVGSGVLPLKAGASPGIVETLWGAFCLRDLKPLLDGEGSTGSQYVIIASEQGTAAWIVDSVEEPVPHSPEKIVALPEDEMISYSGAFDGCIETPGASRIYILSAEKLAVLAGTGKRSGFVLKRAG